MMRVSNQKNNKYSFAISGQHFAHDFLYELSKKSYNSYSSNHNYFYAVKSPTIDKNTL